MKSSLKQHATPLVALLMVCLCLGVVYAYPLIADYTPPPTDCKAVIYVSDPIATMNGTSDCVYCNRLVADLKKHYKIADNGKRIVGTSRDAIFQVAKAPPQLGKVPLVVYYYNNGTKAYIDGYKGNHREVALKHLAFGGRGGARNIQVQTVSNKTDGFQLRGTQLRPLTYDEGPVEIANGEIRPTEENYTPFLPDPPAAQRQTQQTDEVQLTCNFGYNVYASSCAASSYGSPYASSCSASSAYSVPYSSCGIGGGGGGMGGGGDFYTPPQYSFNYGYAAPYGYRPQPQRYQPMYASASYGYQNYAPMGRRMVCGANGCYYLP